jgi:hypothetical protein
MHKKIRLEKCSKLARRLARCNTNSREELAALVISGDDFELLKWT